MNRNAGIDSPSLSKQKAIRERAFHPTGEFVEFSPGEIEQSLASRFEEQVRKHGNRVAVKVHHEGELPTSRQWTYDELNRAANRLAHTIFPRGGDEEAPVALLVDGAAATIVGILGVLKAGRIFVTLDPEYPDERLATMLRDSGAELVVTTGEGSEPGSLAGNERAARLHMRPEQVIDLDDLLALSSDLDENPNLEVPPDALAYIIYTSGSTGQPKGIAFDHRSVLAGIRNYTNAFHISADDRLTLLHSISFSSAMVDIFCALLNGASLYPWNVKKQGLAGLEGWLAEEEITICDWVPTPFRYFVDVLSGETRFPHLRLLVLASEAVTRREVELYRKHFAPGCILVNRLGATETYNYRLYFLDHDTALPAAGNRVPAGYPVRDKQVLLFDDAGQQVGPGEQGEIVVRSKYLARGYWRQPEQTKAAFRPDPEGGEERLYWTGDVGLLHDDGLLEYLGRTDFQVKIRGFRIEVAEIERALLEIEGIEEAVVVAESTEAGTLSTAAGTLPAGAGALAPSMPPPAEGADAAGILENGPGALEGKRLVGYIVPSPSAPLRSGTLSTPLRSGTLSGGHDLSRRALREILSRTLPDYMIPAAFVTLDELPLTASGKVDRRALATLAPWRQEPEGPHAGPHPAHSASLRDPAHSASLRDPAHSASLRDPDGDLGQGHGNGDPRRVEPRDEMERRMVRAWQQVLGRHGDRVGVRDNFFELGGHSMSAVRLLVEIEREFGQKIAPPTFYQYPTVEELTQVLRTRSGSSLPAQQRPDAGPDTFASLSASWSPLVAVQRPPAQAQSAGLKLPFFCVPGNLGNVFTDLGDLARFLGPDQPFFGFQDGPQNPSQIPALASMYVREMRRVQPHGPYFLGGVCLGAVVAYEMAQQLVKQGEEVSLLAMVEPARPWRPSPKATLSFLGYLYDRFVRRIGYAREVHRDGDRVHRDGDHGRQPQGLAEQSAFLRMKLKLVKNVWALRRYTPQPYPGPIHAFLSEGSLNIQGNPQLEWRHLARGEWSVHSIPGDHGSITGDNRITIEPAHMLVLAQKLRTAIDERIRPDVGKDPYDSYAPGSSRASSHENADPG